MLNASHSLPFEDGGTWFRVLQGIADDGYNWRNFRVGTITGLYSNAHGAYHILAIENSVPHNGHFDEALGWFQASSERDRMPLNILEVNNSVLAKTLLRRGFLPVFGTKHFRWTPTT